MSTQVKSRAEHILDLCKIGAKRKGCRVKKLQDAGARDSVINAAAWRLIRNQQRLGNIREYIEGNFWHDDSDARNKLISRALDAERQAYLRASDRIERRDPAAFDDLKQFAMDSEDALDIERVIERQELEAEEIAADDARKQEAVKEFAIMREAINAYGETLPHAHRQALWWIWREPKLTNKAIADNVRMTSVRGIKPETVSAIRSHFYSLAVKVLELMHPEDAVATLSRKVESLEKEMEVMRAERRRDAWLRVMSVEDFEAYRASAMFAEAAQLLGTDIDGLLGATITPARNTAT